MPTSDTVKCDRKAFARIPMWCGVVLLVGMLASSVTKAEQETLLLEPGDRLVVLGDSISAMSKYTVLMDLYLAACRPDLNITFYQDAISGEDTARFLRRMDGMLERARPDVAISFYGVNDTGWVEYTPEVGERYEANTREVLRRLREANVRAMLASTSAMGPNLETMERLNTALAHIQDIAQRVAEDTQTPYADVHADVLAAQTVMREKMGEEYDIIGRDGAHADWQAHMAIATTMLRSLGLGLEPVAIIEIDAESGQANASDGHTIVASDARSVVVESERYPFYFLWDNPGENFRDMPVVAEEMGFFDDLNRFILVVKNLPEGEYDVKWDRVSKTFTADELAEGVNLAHAFKRTPFDAKLYQLWQMSLTKCSMNAAMVIDAVHHRQNLAERSVQIKKLFGDAHPALDMDEVIRDAPERILTFFEQKQAEIRQPVQHTITMTPKS